MKKIYLFLFISCLSIAAFGKNTQISSTIPDISGDNCFYPSLSGSLSESAKFAYHSHVNCGYGVICNAHLRICRDAVFERLEKPPDKC